MTSIQFRTALDRLGLSQVGAAALFGLADRSIRRWAGNEADIPHSAVIVLGLMLSGKITQADVAAVQIDGSMASIAE